MAALMTPWGVDQSWSCRSIRATGAGATVSPVTFHAKSPLTTWIVRISPTAGMPPPRGGISARERSCSSRSEAVS